MDATEFKRRFLPCAPALYRTAFRLLGNGQDAEDMVQEAFAKLWSKRDELGHVVNDEAYGVTLIKNLCYDSLRLVRPETDARPPDELPLADPSNPAREAEQRDDWRQLRRLIGRLPEIQQRIVTMRDVDECSFEEIEKATGMTSGNIRVLLSRARKKIREQFNKLTDYERK